MYPSSPSVYGLNTKTPFRVGDNVDHAVSLYAATKKSNELMAHIYSHLYNLLTTGLRFFSVYGTWGRPDMASYIFSTAILEGRPIDIYNNGHMEWDFTYIDDIVENVVRISEKIPPTNPSWSADRASAGNVQASQHWKNTPVKLITMIEMLENALGKNAIKNFLPLQSDDVKQTYADIEDLGQAVGLVSRTALSDGLLRFSDCYLARRVCKND